MSKLSTDSVVGFPLVEVSKAKKMIGRNGAEVKPRNHYLSKEKQDLFLKEIEEKGHFIPPHKVGTVYWGIGQALVELGENKSHLIGVVLRKFEDVMKKETRKVRHQNSWDHFATKAPRVDEGAKDIYGRLLQDITVLQRLGGQHPYGIKYVQLRACIDILKNERGALLVQLRTGIPLGEMIYPVNESKKKLSKRVVGAVSGVRMAE